jgi:hypothetical protein
MILRPLLALLALLALAGGCSRTTPDEKAPAATAEAPPVATTPVTPAFAGKTWRVTESTGVAPGSTYEFATDGVLRMTAPGSTPAEGTWKWEEGVLTMTEEGIPYRIDILALDDSTFKIRSHNPGPPVDITMVREP